MLLFPGMFANFELDHSMRDEYDTGMSVTLFSKKIVINIIDLISRLFQKGSGFCHHRKYRCNNSLDFPVRLVVK